MGVYWGDNTTIQGEKPASVPENQPKVKNPENQKIIPSGPKKGPKQAEAGEGKFSRITGPDSLRSTEYIHGTRVLRLVHTNQLCSSVSPRIWRTAHLLPFTHGYFTGASSEVAPSW